MSSTFPKVNEAKDITVEITPERIERGKYLANNLCVCMDCHTTSNWSKFAGPPDWEELGAGGEVFNEDMNFPGKFISKNITPFALDDWTDGEILRVITVGVNKDGHALFPVMPWPNYVNMAEEDVYSLIAYLRSLKPIERENEESSDSFPMSIILKTMPKDVELTAEIPARSDKVSYGKYLVNAASCGDCHTKSELGEVVGEPFAGGFEFKLYEGVLRSANITPDVEHGIGSWSEQMFVDKFKSYDPTYMIQSQ